MRSRVTYRAQTWRKPSVVAGYKMVHQVGSHIILETEEPAHQRIAIPDHRPLRLGTLVSILRAVALTNA